MDPWLLWILAAVVLALGEIATLGFFLAPFAAGALLAGLVAALGGGTTVSIVVFIAFSVVFLAGIQPIARRHRRMPPRLRSGTYALVGKTGTVTERISNADDLGYVKVDGELWRARAYVDDTIIEPGIRVQIVEITGATALVAE
jgi:membrane protein implicated in regulation of membrane protease activity